MGNWFEGKTEAEIEKHYQRDEADFYAGNGNYAEVGGMFRYDSNKLNETHLAEGHVDVLDSLVEGDTAEAEVKATTDEAMLIALKVYDAMDRRRKLHQTALAAKVVDVDIVTGKPNMSALARELGVSRPTAIGRWHKLVDIVTTDQTFRHLWINARN